MKTTANNRAFTYIETLVAALIVGITLMALSRLWGFAYGVTADIDDQGVAYSLARQALEKIHQTGFYNTAEGTTTTYYDSQQVSVAANASSRRYQIVTTVTSSSTIAGSSPVAPSDDALRTVVITATVIPTGQVTVQTGCYLVRGGL